MIRVWFKDIDWENIDEETIPLSYGNELIVFGREVAKFVQPDITEDTWKGKTFPVQITNYESYKVKFAVKEPGVHMLSKILSCKTVWIENLTTNEKYKVDTQTSGKFTIETVNLGTVENSVILNFSTKRTPVYPGIARLNTYALTITIGLTDYVYYTDFEPIQTITDSVRAESTYNDGKILTSKTLQKTGYRLLFYFMESDAVQLKTQLESAQPENVDYEGLEPDEMGVCQLTELTEGLYKCEVQLIMDNIVNFKYS